MKSFFSPAIAVMNRLGYTRKFALLALMSLLAVGVMTFSLFTNISRDIGTSQRELEGIALFAPTFRAVQLVQRHRALDAAVIKGVESMRGEHDAIARAVDDALDEMEVKLPAALKAALGWPEIRKNWVLLRSDGLNWTADVNFAAQTSLIGQILFLQTAIADEYGLILDSDAGSYYLIDIIVNELPHVIEHLGQLRAQGLTHLIDRRITEQQKMRTGAVINELGDALKNLDINLKKAARYNPALQDSLLAASGDIADSVEQVTGLMESDILTGRFTMTPEKYYAMASVAIDASYQRLHESLLSATEILLKERIAKARNTLYITMGIASLLLLAVTYFAIGVYYSIVGSAQSLARSAHAFAEGDMRERIRLDTRDELNQIGDSFNKMADGFNAMFAAQKQAEIILQGSESKYRRLHESMRDAFVMVDISGRLIEFNHAYQKMLGYSAEELKRLTYVDLTPEKWHEFEARIIEEQVIPHDQSTVYEKEYIRKDGAVFPVELRTFLIRGENNQPEAMWAIVRDITERKLAGDMLRVAATTFETDEGILITDVQGKIIRVNQAFENITGYSQEEVLGKNPRILNSDCQDKAFYAAMWQQLLNNGSWTGELWNRRKGGQIYPERLTITAVKNERGATTEYVAIFSDITERKQAEEKLHKYNDELAAINHQLQDTQNMLLQSEKMSSIGQLAAGVAHEINNPIGYVYSNLGTLEKYVQDTFGMIDLYEQAESAISDSEVLAQIKAARNKLDIDFLKKDLRALMNESKDGITRVKQIVQNLKDFSHVDTSDEWHFADLRKGLDSTLNIVNNEIKYKADVVREYGDIPEIECLLSQLNQVFMNLLVNASHAIEERGTITIRTGTHRTGQQRDEVWVEVEDTGKGIASEHLKKIFDPFFTTKPIGKGTGLGLSLSYGIIQKHHGCIEVQSEVGKGTTFRVWLPVKHTDSPPSDLNGGNALLPDTQDFSI